VRDIIARGWSVDPGARGSFDYILDALWSIRFKMTVAVDMDKVGEFVTVVDPSVAPKPGLIKEGPRLDRLTQGREFPPSIRKAKITDWSREVEIDVPDGIIAHLTRECGGNVHDHHVIDVTSRSFGNETYGANPHSGAYDNMADLAARNAADLATDSRFLSAYRKRGEDIPHTRDNWVCYDFQDRKIVSAYYTVRPYSASPGGGHLES
jgi:hypothetical protein